MSPTKVRNASRLKIRKQLQQFDFYNCEHVSPLSKCIRLSLSGFSPPQNWPHQVNRIHSKQSDESKNSVIRRNKNQLKLLGRHWGLKGLCLRGIPRRWQFVLISWRLQLLQTLGEERSRWPLVIVLVRPFFATDNSGGPGGQAFFLQPVSCCSRWSFNTKPGGEWNKAICFGKRHWLISGTSTWLLRDHQIGLNIMLPPCTWRQRMAAAIK